MTIKHQYPAVNPKLRTFYAIFASALAGTVMLFIILERLGMGKFWLSHLVSALPLFFAGAIGVITMTNNKDDFFLAGRRVPASFNGFALALTSLGGVGLLSVTGLFFLIGFDALALLLGWCLGFVLIALLYAPYLRRMGAYSLPGFFAERFQSRSATLICAALVSLPIFLILVAELKICAFTGFLITGLPKTLIIAAVCALILFSTILGGLRSLTWSQCAHFIVVLAGYLIPLFILAVLITNLPLPQLTYGTLFDDLVRLELTNGLSDVHPQPLSQSLGGTSPEAINKLFLQTFGAIGRTEFIFLLLCFLFGTATLPSLLIRASTTPSIHDARISLGWGLCLLGLLLVSAPAYAVFAKYLTLQNLIGATIDQLPEWTKNLINLRLLEIRDQDQNSTLGLKELFVLRDGIAFILPIMAGLPFALIILTVTGALSAAIGSASAQIVAIANMAALDLTASGPNPSAQSTRPLYMARAAMVAVTALAAWTALSIDTDPLWLLAWALSLSASTLFVTLTLAVFWSRFSASGAIAAMIGGFAACLAYIWLTPPGMPGLIDGINHLVAGIVGMPVSLAAALIATSIGRKPADGTRQMLDDLRSPGHATLLETRQRASQRRKTRPR